MTFIFPELLICPSLGVQNSQLLKDVVNGPTDIKYGELVFFDVILV